MPRKPRSYKTPEDYQKLNYGVGLKKRTESDKSGLLGRHQLPWSEYELQYLKDNATKLDIYEIARHLKRTPYAVEQKGYKLKVLASRRKKRVMVIHAGLVEMREIKRVHEKVTQMRSLIALAENETNNYKKDQIKKELKKLSGL